MLQVDGLFQRKERRNSLSGYAGKREQPLCYRIARLMSYCICFNKNLVVGHLRFWDTMGELPQCWQSHVKTIDKRGSLLTSWEVRQFFQSKWKAVYLGLPYWLQWRLYLRALLFHTVVWGGSLQWVVWRLCKNEREREREFGKKREMRTPTLYLSF